MTNGDGLWDQLKDDDGGWYYVFPDQLNFQKEPFATVIPIRSTSFKVHKTEGLANSALSHHKQGAKYKQENGVWVKVWEFKEPTNCDTCDISLDKDRDRPKDRWGYHTSWRRSPLHKGSKILQPYLCDRCYRAELEVLDERNKAKQWRAEQKKKGK